MSLKSSLQNRELTNKNCPGCQVQAITKSTFIKTNGRKSSTVKGPGHSVTALKNFNRRNSASSIQSAGPSTSSNYVSIRQLLANQEACPLPNNCKFQFTEQRCNYERMAKSHHSSSSTASPSKSSVAVDANTDAGNTLSSLPDEQADQISSQFLALREFRLNNRNECFGDGRHMVQDEIVKSESDTPKQSNEQLLWILNKHVSSTTPPYALRQTLLRTELAKDFTNRLKQIEYKNRGLNKSLALSYQPMYSMKKT
ncbi:uncharacterized protein LOC106087699 [Stomoxys calcitrans]|uniref:uncharacterized protein LOC106087699 n=1 Tax=Stomoxys calcitrans TaxID=35570 RepID=UPI0027E2E76E|nr:uncharacterized protein LOC106087699 [Stomoxys calcitrans]